LEREGQRKGERKIKRERQNVSKMEREIFSIYFGQNNIASENRKIYI